jgi:hypothetical protein
MTSLAGFSNPVATVKQAAAPAAPVATPTNLIQPITSSTSSKYAALANAPYPEQPVWVWGNGNAPYSQVASAGYDITAPQISLARRNAAYKRANGRLTDGSPGYQYPMFITSVAIDIALAGSTAQSQWTRDFYPRNFTLPSFQISGQALDNEDYGILCEFVHQAQHKTLAGGWQNLMQFNVAGGAFYGGKRKTGLAVTGSDGVSHYNQTLRGGHKPILCKGMVTTMQRTHSAFDFAPAYQFGFIVLAMMGSSIYNEPIDVSVPATTWVGILQAVAAEPDVISTTGSSGSAALVQTNKQIIKTANKNQSTIFSSLSTASGTQSGN